VLERPWAGPLAQPAGWDIALAPLAHATGAAAGALCGLGTALAGRWRGAGTPAVTMPPR
jgi:hypothetical protein